MLSIQSRTSGVRRVPIASKLGGALMVFAGVMDIAVHLVTDVHLAHHEFGAEHLAHLLGIGGMLLVLAGVAIHGVRLQLRQRAARTGGLDGHANR